MVNTKTISALFKAGFSAKHRAGTQISLLPDIVGDMLYARPRVVGNRWKHSLKAWPGESHSFEAIFSP